MVTIGDKLKAYRGIGPGFDFLRVGLALAVVVWHSDYISVGSPRLDAANMVWFAGYAILALFFCLSGFLITGSAQRLKLRDFLINRGLRIFPALIVEIVLSAFVLGFIFTQLKPLEYLSNPGTYHYLTNIIGWPNYQLPGVFAGNPSNVVNVSIWTIPYELACYAIMSVLIVTAALKRPWLVLAATAAFMILGFVLLYGGFAGPEHGIVGQVISKFITGLGSRLFASFLLGIAAYLYRDKIPYDWRLMAASVALCVVVMVVGPAPELFTYPVLNLLVVPALAYITAFLGVSNLPTLPLFHKGDYSYGIYLYGFPIQQAVVAMFPAVTNGWLQLLIALPLITLFSVFSWHVIEKPILALRKKFSFVARVREVDDGPVSARALPIAADPDAPTKPAIVKA